MKLSDCHRRRRRLLVTRRPFLLAALLLTALSLSRLNAKPQFLAVIRYYNSSDQLQKEWRIPLNKQGALKKTANGDQWRLKIAKTRLHANVPGYDFQATFRLEHGGARLVTVGCGFSLSGWTTNDYVLFPGEVYDGNRFHIKPSRYPPLWRNPKEFRLDMPVTMRPGPHLGGPDHSNAIRLNSGDVTTPLIGIQDPVRKRGYILLTTQTTRLGNNGLDLELSDHGTQALVLATAPALRGPQDAPARFKPGDSVTLHVRIYSFQAAEVQALFNAEAQVRSRLNPSTRQEQLPFSAAFDLVEQLYSRQRWDPKHSFFWLSKRRPGHVSMNMIWQLGWVGGGQITLGFLQAGTPLMRQRALKNLGMIFQRTQTPSGLFNTFGDGTHFYSDGFSTPHPYYLTLVRKQADWLYSALKQFKVMDWEKRPVPKQWQSGVRRLANAFVTLWDRYHQFGQFANVETGRLEIGGSCAGALIPAGLALASEYFHTPRYLDIAKKAAAQYEAQFVRHGLTTGGPGDIFSAPDSESAFAMLESFVVLYETTGQQRWLTDARDMAAQCASWVVSYDFQFPPGSVIARIGAHTRGAVWANISNRHAAPGICTLSGDSLLRLWRASGDPVALELLKHIAHGITQYVSRPDRPVGTMPPGGICERVNLSDWEGKKNIGGNIFGSASWCETAVVLTYAEVPGLYVQPDTGFFCAFDNIQAKRIAHTRNRLVLKLTNPTLYPADVSVLSETSKEARNPLPYPTLKNATHLLLKAGETRTVEFDCK